MVHHNTYSISQFTKAALCCPQSRKPRSKSDSEREMGRARASENFSRSQREK